MYKTYREFWADYRSVANYYQEFNNALNWVAPLDPERAWDIYQQARHQRYGVLVMGRTCVDEPHRRPADFGNAITDADHQALGVITHHDEAANVLNGTAGIANMHVANGGMIMHYYNALDSAWRHGRSGYHFLYNDAWLLGGAHGTRDFNLASPRRRTNLWDNNANRLTATGREAVFLDSCGYRVMKIGRGGLEVFTSIYDHRAKAATFQSLVQAMRSATSFARIQHLCV